MAANTEPSIEELMRQLEALRKDNDYYKAKSDALDAKLREQQNPGGGSSNQHSRNNNDPHPEGNNNDQSHEEYPEFEGDFENMGGRGGNRGRGRGRGPVRGEHRGYGGQDFVRDDPDFKMDLPTFEGKHDPEEFVNWLQIVERNFELKENLTEERKMRLVATKLRGYASLWWDNLVRRREQNGRVRLQTWTRLKEEMSDTWLPRDYRQK